MSKLSGKRILYGRLKEIYPKWDIGAVYISRNKNLNGTYATLDRGTLTDVGKGAGFDGELRKGVYFNIDYYFSLVPRHRSSKKDIVIKGEYNVLDSSKK